MKTKARTTGSKSPVVRDVVANDLCIGCGACAGICPANCLDIQWNAFGGYWPVEGPGCTGCELCAKVCPFTDGNPNEDELAEELFGSVPGVSHRPDCGWYLHSFAGHAAADGHRARGASGGLLTWTLESLLKRGVVDAVITAQPNPDPDKLFKFAVVDSVDGLRECAGSCYYPLEMSQALRFVLENDGRYAFVGLPCFVKAVRLASRANKKLRDRLVFCAGLVCSMLASKFLAEYIMVSAGVDPGTIKRLAFRGKAPDHTARDYVATYGSNPESPDPDGSLTWSRLPCFAFGRWFFTPNACEYCDDAFAELADAAFMDAWLRDYDGDPAGNSIAIVRNQLAADLMLSGVTSGELAISEIPIGRALASQPGVVASKRAGLAARLRLAKSRRLWVPSRRVKPSAPLAGEVARQMLSLHIQAASRRAWAESRGQGLLAFQRRMPVYGAMTTGRHLVTFAKRVTGGLKRRVREAAARLARCRERA